VSTCSRPATAHGRALLQLAIGMLASGAAAAQSLSPVVNLAFGSFLAGSGGTVVVGTGGSRSKTGGVLLIGQGGGVAAAQFNVSGSASVVYSITLPSDHTVVLSDAGSNTMALNNFISNPGASGVLSAGGSQLLSVGATLTVGPGQAPGGYAGSFSITVNFQ